MKFLICLGLFFSSVLSNEIVRFTNNCTFPIWVVYQSHIGKKFAGNLPLLEKEFKEVRFTEIHSVRVWTKTNCDGNGLNCETGDCGPFGCVPATLVELTFGINGNLNFYDVSLAEGFNLPITVAPLNSTSQEGHVCGMAKCDINLNDICPEELRVVNATSGETVACLNGCAKYHTDEFCCAGDNSTQTSCNNSEYAEFFKGACPDAYSYAFDSEATFYCPRDDSDKVYEIFLCA